MAEIDWDEFAKIFDYFNSPKYNVVLPMFCAWMVERLDERAASLENASRDPGRMIEVGCGTGLVSELMADWYPKTEFLLNDNNEAMLRVARERFEGRETSVGIEEADGADFVAGLADDSVEVFIFSRSLYAMKDPAAVAADVIRALEPGGLVMMLDFLSPVELEPLDQFFAAAEPETWPICRVVYEDFNAGIEDGRYHVYSKEGLVALWRSAGGKPITYQTNAPTSNTHFMCITKQL